MAMLVIMRTTLGDTGAVLLLLDCGPLRQAPLEDVAARDARRAGLGVAPLELPRRLPDQLAEPAAEGAEAREPDRVADLVTVRFVARSRSWARSMRRSETYAAGVRPYVALKSRWKWNLLRPAIPASASRSSGSA